MLRELPERLLATSRGSVYPDIPAVIVEPVRQKQIGILVRENIRCLAGDSWSAPTISEAAPI
jgi:hypothetical protein